MLTAAILVTFTCCVANPTPLHDKDISTTTELPTTFPTGCYYNGKIYPPGSEIENGYDPRSNWCYGAHCDMYGNVQQWDNFNCLTTSTTTPEPTTVPGCIYNGKYYPFGSTIDKGYDPSSNWCYSTYCDTNGQILHGDDFNCVKTTTTTTPELTTVPGCIYHGKHYPRGSTIEIGHKPDSNWCYSTVCNMNGQILHGGIFNCMTTTVPAPSNPVVG